MEEQKSTGEAPKKPPTLDQIKVAHLRTTFFWPLTLDRDLKDGGGFDQKAFLKCHDEWLKGSPWEAEDDGLRHLPLPNEDPKDTDLGLKTDLNAAKADAYGEYVYFHDFVQKMLFGITGGQHATGPLRLYQRKDIKQLEVDFGDAVRLFDVERVNLYLLEYGVAVIAVQVSVNPATGLSLSGALKINDTLRRSHIPFFKPQGERIVAADMPVRVTWNGAVTFRPLEEGTEAKDKKLVRTPYDDLMKMAPVDRAVLPLGHWRWLLNGSDEVEERFPISKVRGGYRWRHFSDDRFPILTTVVLRDRKDYFNMPDGHWNRLAFVDAPGSDPNPYAAAFLQGKLEKQCYDRFHRKREESDDAPVRYLMCDYAMTAVTHENSFAQFIQMHMQRHYYQMFLLQVIDKAVMLGLSSRITQAVEKFGSVEAETNLSRTLQEIERDFLQYVHRFRFTGISGQLQASELHAKLREVMGLDAMFNDIKGELETAVGFLSSRQSEHATEAAERLNIIASLGVVIALVMGFFSMNTLTDKELILGISQKLSWFFWGQPIVKNVADVEQVLLLQVIVFGLFLGMASGLAFCVSGFIGERVGLKGRPNRAAESLVHGALKLVSVLGFAFAVLAACLLIALA